VALQRIIIITKQGVIASWHKSWLIAIKNLLTFLWAFNHSRVLHKSFLYEKAQHHGLFEFSTRSQNGFSPLTPLISWIMKKKKANILFYNFFTTWNPNGVIQLLKMVLAYSRRLLGNYNQNLISMYPSYQMFSFVVFYTTCYNLKHNLPFNN